MLNVTLRELVLAVSDCAQSEAEVVATVVHMITSGRVRLRADMTGAVAGVSAVRSAPSLA